MKKKLNCWEFKDCGFGPGGRNTDLKGPCPAAVTHAYDGVNGGQAGGRFCWMVENTSCNNLVIIDFKFIKCTECDFYQLVEKEEARSLVLTKWDLNRDHFKVQIR